MPESLQESIVERRTRQSQERLAAGEMWIDMDFVFATLVGTPTDPSNLRRVLDRACVKAGIGHFSPNELRHSFASLLSNEGVPLDRVADAMGHVDTRMTSAVYRHRLSQSVSDAVAPMDRLFSPMRTACSSLPTLEESSWLP